MECFNCGKPILNPSVNCPHCGYRFTAGDNRTCPNKICMTCVITENPCLMGSNFSTCPVKNKADKEAQF